MPELLDFQKIQQQFTDYIRDPKDSLLFPDIEKERLYTYRDLISGGLIENIGNAYPVLRSLYDENDWACIIHDFLKIHESHTPYFPQMAHEFLDYLENERDDSNDPPWFYELAHYERIEVDVNIDPHDVNWDNFDTNIEVLDHPIILSPLAKPIAYQYPVHKIGQDFQPQEQPGEQTYLIIYRDKSDKVNFYEMNIITAHLIELSRLNPSYTGKKLLELIAHEIKHPNPSVVIEGGKQILIDLMNLNILLGKKKD